MKNITTPGPTSQNPMWIRLLAICLITTSQNDHGKNARRKYVSFGAFIFGQFEISKFSCAQLSLRIFKIRHGRCFSFPKIKLGGGTSLAILNMALGGREAFISGDRFSTFSFKNFNHCRKPKTTAPDIFLKTCRGKNEKSIFEKSNGVNKWATPEIVYENIHDCKI